MSFLTLRLSPASRFVLSTTTSHRRLSLTLPNKSSQPPSRSLPESHELLKYQLACQSFNLPYDADLKQVKLRKNELVKIYHPDVGLEKDHAKFDQVTDDYAVIREFQAQFPEAVALFSSRGEDGEQSLSSNSADGSQDPILAASSKIEEEAPTERMRSHDSTAGPLLAGANLKRLGVMIFLISSLGLALMLKPIDNTKLGPPVSKKHRKYWHGKWRTGYKHRRSIQDQPVVDGIYCEGEENAEIPDEKETSVDANSKQD